MATFEITVDNLRSVGEMLIPYNFPLAHKDLEKDIAPLKKSEVEVDGYSLIIHFNKAKYKGYYLETFQIYNKYGPFLPFSLVVKMACKSLGGHLLSLVEFYQDDRKVYCWSVCVDEDGKPRPSPIEEESEPCEFEGFAYKYMHPDQLNFY